MIGFGECKLRQEFQALLQDPDEVQTAKFYSPDEIVETVKMKINYSLHFQRSQTVSQKNLKVVDKFSNKTNNMHCPNIELIRGKSSESIPTYHSTEKTNSNISV